MENSICLTVFIFESFPKHIGRSVVKWLFFLEIRFISNLKLTMDWEGRGWDQKWFYIDVVHNIC